jgi:HAMP domain-containing protein
VAIEGDYAVAYLPVKDYQGKPIGVITLARDISVQNAILDSAVVLVLILFGLAVLVPILTLLGVMRYAVFRPLNRIRDLAEQVSRGNLAQGEPATSRDEIGAIHRSAASRSISPRSSTTARPRPARSRAAWSALAATPTATKGPMPSSSRA